MKNLLIICLVSLLSMFLTKNGHSNTAPDTDDIIIEISDKFNEVKIGITETYVYMVFSESIREIANQTFVSQYEIDSQAFEDSDGNFITGNLVSLSSNRIEISRDEISEITFRNGKLHFSYVHKPTVSFEDIYSYKGTKALENFYVEDLEKLILAYSS